jgi:hypothetical protein
MGGRFQNLAQYFQQYRIRKGAYFEYIPYNALNTQQEVVSGPTSTPSYAMRNMVWLFVDDPSLSLANFTTLVDSGGIEFNTNERKRLSIPASAWKWVSTTSASPTSIDLRMCTFGALLARFRQTSTTAASTYGEINFVGVVEWRYPITPTGTIGVSPDEKEPSPSHLTPLLQRMSLLNSPAARSNSSSTSPLVPVKEGIGSVNRAASPPPAAIRGGAADPTTGSTGWFKY